MLNELKKRVYEMNKLLVDYDLVTFTWGNVSQIDRNTGLIAIKPSGVRYEDLKIEDIVIVNLEGEVQEGELSPSSDMDTHILLYKGFPEVGGIVHTHSTFATSWAQAGLGIPCYGTTHADYFYGEIPCTRELSEEEIEKEYEKNTGKLIVETFYEKNISPLSIPAVLCKNHGPFTWGKNCEEALHNAVVLEEVAKMACISKGVNPDLSCASRNLQDKHFFRKHGENAYYGQK